MANTIKDYENKIKELMDENYRLSIENLKLKNERHTKTTATKPRTSTKKTATKAKAKTQPKKTKKTQTKKEMTTFQKKREEKKDVVAKEMNKHTAVPEIAKKIGQSEPTVRNYIRELRLEKRISC